MKWHKWLCSAAALLPLAIVSAESPPLRDDLCVAANVFFEARAEPLKGMIAVKDVTRNRGKNACSVVFEKHQFSWTAKTPWSRVQKFLVDKPTHLKPEDRLAWEKCKEIAQSDRRVLSKDYMYFHSVHVSPPWTRAGLVIGNHKFIKDFKLKGRKMK